MKRFYRVVTATMLCLGSVHVGSADAAPADSPPVSGNLALTSDYVFRGLTQSWGRPAIQAGVDYAAANGCAAGLWGSSVSERSYPGGATELDLYASYGHAIASDWAWHAGLYAYLYPGANLDQTGLAPRSPDTIEANAALGWKWLTLKYNRALTDYFGADVEQGYRGNSRGTSYLQLDADFALGERWSLALHVGHTHYAAVLAAPLASGTRDPGYGDSGATLKYRLDGRWSLNGGLTHATNAAFYRRTPSLLDAGDSRDVGGTRGFLMLQGTF